MGNNYRAKYFKAKTLWQHFLPAAKYADKYRSIKCIRLVFCLFLTRERWATTVPGLGLAHLMLHLILVVEIYGRGWCIPACT
jgi:hypothetical protein